jgi:hypothetical protein
LIAVAAPAYIAAMSDEKKETRLPPPAFPPGARKHLHANSNSRPASARPVKSAGHDAFISPDDPMPPRRDALGDAFISPDDPMPVRRPDPVFDAFISPDDPMPVRGHEEGVVTGIGDDPHLDPAELISGGDPHVIELIGAVGRLADALARKGEAGLKAAPHMSRFEATLRAYCLGYLAGRRVEDAQTIPEIVE